jgi:hypothetical protein
MTGDQVLASPYFLVGSLPAIVEHAQALRERSRERPPKVRKALALGTCSGGRQVPRQLGNARQQGSDPVYDLWSASGVSLK